MASNCSKAGYYLASCFTTKRAGHVFRSAMRMTRKRMWAAITLRRRLRTRSKCSVDELKVSNDRGTQGHFASLDRAEGLPELN